MLKLLCIFVFFTTSKGDSDPYENSHLQFDMSNHVPGEPLSPIDFQNAEGIMESLSDGNKHINDPIELAGEFEGDIILPYEFHNKTLEDIPNKNAIISKKEKWPGGNIPYIIDAMFSPWERSIIAKSFLEYKKKTCITFLPRTTEYDYIHIVKGQGCSSHVGRMGGGQRVTLGNGCVFTGIAIHELMHAVGFWHEQSRWDRDDYVTVLKNNVSPGMEYNFQKYSWKYIQNLGVPYDTSSIMHYGRYAFSRDRKSPTILPKSPNDRMGQREDFSAIDIEKINRLYECNEYAQPSTTTPIPTTDSDLDSNSTETTDKPPPDPISQCSDLHNYCPKWALKNECKRNAPWMLVNCRKSCHRCNSPCEDTNKYCPLWSNRGECDANPHYMNSYCRKSCNSCPKPNPNPNPGTGGDSKCKDTNQHCAKWAELGECEKNPKWMLKHCRKSCKVCKNLEISLWTDSKDIKAVTTSSH